MKLLPFMLLLAWSVFGTTYYIDYASGDDSNNGTSKSTPWKHAPGMMGNSGSPLAYEAAHSSSLNTDVAGDAFIFKGGVTWANDCFVWSWKWGGGTGWTVGVDAVYFGVDSTWYAGASWARPIFDAQATDVTPNDKSSPNIDNTMWRIYKGDGGYFIVDNLEIKGMYHFDNNEDMMLNFDVGIGEIKNCYFHGWGHGAVTDTGAGCGGFDYCNVWDSGDDAGVYCNSAFRVIATPYDDENNDIRIHHCYIDGSDSYPTPGDMANATKGFIRHFYNNYVTHVQNAITNNFCWYVWGNTFDSVAIITDFVSNNHHNLYQSYNGLGKKSYVYNNLIKNTSGGATFLWYPTDSTVFFVFNNLIYGDYNATLAFSSSEINSGTNTAGLYAWNNTLQLVESNNFFAIGGSASGYAADTFFVKNNHLISEATGLQPRIDTVHQDTASNLQGDNAAATSDGYTSGSTYPYAPQTGDAITVGTGVDLSLMGGVVVDSGPSIPTTACLYDTPLGVSVDEVNHTVSYPNRTPLFRSGSWDIGAYQFSGLSSRIKNKINTVVK